VDAVSEQEFHEIFHEVCSDVGLQYETDIIDELIDVIQSELKERLRACHPRDIVNQVRWAARYKEKEPRLDRPALHAAVDAYFVRE
jgi:hypothetical protein